jgi:hypothetical protein
VRLEVGSPGQFDVLVDGQRVASRGGGFFKRLLGGGWPDEGEVVMRIRGLADAAAGPAARRP